MDRLERLSTFVRIVEEGSLSAAARRSGLTVPAVSKQLRTLERELGAELLRRTTRWLALTEAGMAAFHRARRLLADYQETCDLVSGAGEGAPVRLVGDAGVLRAVAVPAIAALLAARPGSRVELRPWAEGTSQLPGEADIALVGGTLEDSPLRVAHRLSDGPRVLCAAPAYLASAPHPAQPGDLTRHTCLVGGTLGRSAAWTLRREGEPGPGTAVRVDGPLRTCSDEALREAALRGLGIALLPRWLVADDLDQGRLRRIVPEVSGPPLPVHALYARDRAGAPKLALVIEALAARCLPGAAPGRGAGRRSA